MFRENASYAQELMRTTGQMGVPVTIIDGQTVIGFDRVRLEQLLTQRHSQQRPVFGVTIADASKLTAKGRAGITLGAFVGRIKSGSIAERIGLVPGDIITELNMNRISNAGDLERALSNLNRGSRFSLVFLRDKKTMTTEGIY